MIQIQAMYALHKSISDVEDVEYNSIIADVPDNRVVARVENGVTNSHK